MAVKKHRRKIKNKETTQSTPSPPQQNIDTQHKAIQKKKKNEGISQQARKNIFPFRAIFKKLIVVTSFIFNFWLGYLAVKPNIDVFPSNPTHDTFPFEVIFNIKNNSQFTINNVIFFVTDLTTTIEVSENELPKDRPRKFKWENEINLSDIKPGHSVPAETRKITPYNTASPKSAVLSFKVLYSMPLFKALRFSDNFTYKLFKQKNGTYEWIEISENQLTTGST
jgi:hypothetical protein